MKDKCKDCEERDNCPEVAIDEIHTLSWKLSKMLGESGIKPSLELIVAMLGMVCIVAKEIGMPMSRLKKSMLRAAEMFSATPASSEALKDLPPDSRVH